MKIQFILLILCDRPRKKITRIEKSVLVIAKEFVITNNENDFKQE